MGSTKEGPPPAAFLTNSDKPALMDSTTSLDDPDPEKYGVVQFNPYVSEDEELMEYDYDSDSSLPPYPSDTLPAIVVNDDFTMIEGAALCMYLADLYEQFLPEPDFKAEYYRWDKYHTEFF